jgi:hypothetical protein
VTPAASGCFRCGGAHWVDHCPELQPPGSREEHFRRLDLYLQRMWNWRDGTEGVKWTPEQKTRAISAENAMWKAETAKTESRRN